MAYVHTWGGHAASSADAVSKALAAARRDWPGCSVAVVAVVQVA